jgi:hypothetical protein
VQLARSDMDQVEIVRRTRKMFEETGVMPPIREVDPLATRTNTDTVELANRLLHSDWEALTNEEKSLRGFFTGYAQNLFAITMAVGYVFDVSLLDG